MTPHVLIYGCFACRKMDAADAILHLDELSVFARCSHPVTACSLFHRGACHHHPPLLISRIPLSIASSPLFPATVTATGLGQNYDNERALWLHLLRIGRRGRA